ncbi:hypothetical protein TgHK011_002766 [Trichoderma gracile]|nr:hypothetical protein TgHK011_002766 [Trichoderma gracile]
MSFTVHTVRDAAPFMAHRENAIPGDALARQCSERFKAKAEKHIHSGHYVSGCSGGLQAGLVPQTDP